MNRLSRVITALAVLSVAAVSVVAVSSDAPAVGKSAEAVTPQYVLGYWPNDPQLCIVDLTEDLPVAAAVAQFEPANIDVFMATECADGEIRVPVFMVNDLQCDGGINGCHFRGEDSFEDHEGLWVYSSGPVILLNAKSDLTDRQWTAVIAHELGHLVGLSHTNRRDSIMLGDSSTNGAADNGHDGLTATDIAVINALYP